jgi:hypothetical protein
MVLVPASALALRIILVLNDTLRYVFLTDVEGKSIVVGGNVRRRTIAANAAVH